MAIGAESEQTGWRVIRVDRASAFWTLSFEDSISTIQILGNPNTYQHFKIQRLVDGRWTDVPHVH